MTFSFESDIDLDEMEIWPDGDAPKDWTLNDVVALVAQCGGALHVLSDWDLMPTIRLTVHEGYESRRVL